MAEHLSEFGRRDRVAAIRGDSKDRAEASGREKNDVFGSPGSSARVFGVAKDLRCSAIDGDLLELLLAEVSQIAPVR
jgi:hypothetical protein